MTGDAARRNREDFSRRAGRFREPIGSRDSAPLEEAVSITGFGPGDSLVDIGIGTGNASLPFLKAGGRVAGIEVTPAMARRGKEHLEKEGFGGRFVFANAEAEQSPLADGAADAAICRNVFHHLERPLIVLKEMARAVRRGGHVIIDDFYEPDSEEARAPLHEIECLRVSSHVRTLSEGEFRAMFEEAGLEIIHLAPTFKRRTLSSWMERADSSPGTGSAIRKLFEEMRNAGGGWWEAEREGDDYMFSHKRLTVIGRKA
jgi:ubiquinone/menaquinone biosynthesis C-methylase UbiE